MAAPEPALGQAEPEAERRYGADPVLVPGFPQYRAGGLHRFLFGAGYRDLWVRPLRVPVLDLGRHGGGLTPLRAGGGHQTRTLHLENDEGRRFVFRSVDKFVEQGLPEDVQGTPLGRLIQDHTAVHHPSGALAVPPLAGAAEVLHVVPELVVMPDDPRLGEHQAEFAGMLGTIEERPDELEDGTSTFAGAGRIVGMERMLERMHDNPEDRPDAAAWLAARLLDFVIGDTDRGSDQWRWAEYDGPAERSSWQPIPRDRDFAFLRSDGLLPRLARTVFPKLVAFGPRYPSLNGLLFSSLHLDRPMLAALERAAWDSTTAAVRAALTDDVLAAAVAALPPEHGTRIGGSMLAALRARRDALPAVSRAFYRHITTAVDVEGTTEADRAEVDVLPDGSVRVRLYDNDAYRIATLDAAIPAQAPYYERRFVPGETEEVRVLLRDGDDNVVVRGGASPIVIRVVGGAGDDVLLDSTSARAARVAFYDAAGRNRIEAGPGTRVDERPFEPPATPEAWLERKVERQRYRDWGAGRGIGPRVDYREGAGLVLGARLSRTSYGFRRVPFASRTRIDVLYGTDAGAFGLELAMVRTRENSPVRLTLDAQASRFDAFRFYGLGNATPEPADHDLALVRQDRVRLRPGLAIDGGGSSRVAFGVEADYARPDVRAGTPLDRSGLPGVEPFGALGAWAEGEWQAVRGDAHPLRGVALAAGASATPAFWDVDGAYADAHGELRSYLTFGPTLALRAGAHKVWGRFPAHDAAFVGGRTSLRGFRWQRFAGDAAAWGSAELRVPLGRITLLTRGDVGVLGFVDAGRVFVDGASPGGWHTGTGGGLWFSSLGLTFSGAYAQGEEQRAYVWLGMPF